MRTEIEHTTAQQESEDTRDRILLAAQKFFAENGFDSTSVRDITTEAGCNVASVNYHFGGKDSLYLESFRSMLGLLRDHRLQRVDDLMSRPQPPSIEEFAETFAEIMIEPLVGDPRGRLFLLLVSREMISPRLPQGVLFEEFFEPMMSASADALVKVEPSLDRGSAHLCVMSMVGQLLHSLKAHQLLRELPQTDLLPAEHDQQMAHFVRFAVGGIRACAEADDAALEVRQ